MADRSPSLERRPEARTESIESLVEKARRGFIRVPKFQRGLSWTKRDVIDLFDSVFHGYPIGSLLLWEHRAPAERVALGHLHIDAPETGQAWSVVDGQQRLTALAASLTADAAGHRADQFDIYFDPDQQCFVGPEKRAENPQSWVALSELLDGAALGELLLTTHTLDQRRATFEVARRIREYQVPVYVISTDDETLLRKIFYRVNNTGQPLKWPEIHTALFAKPGRQPSSVTDVADEIATLGMGRPDESHLLSAMLAAVGLDPTRALDEHIERNRDDVARAAAEAMPALRRTFDFLRSRCAVAHIRLIPHWEPIPVLARFFLVHRDPDPRTLQLFVRWVWRGPLTGEYKLDARTLLRRSVECVGGEEHAAIQALLALVPRKPPDKYDVPERFDARTAASRLALLALADLAPRSLEGAPAPLSIAAVIEQHDLSAFLRAETNADIPGVSSGANRFIHPPCKDFLSRIEDRARLNPNDPVLASHAISPQAAQALAHGTPEAFLRERAETLVAAVDGLRNRLAAWGRGDRPPIKHLISSKEGGSE